MREIRSGRDLRILDLGNPAYPCLFAGWLGIRISEHVNCQDPESDLSLKSPRNVVPCVGELLQGAFHDLCLRRERVK